MTSIANAVVTIQTSAQVVPSPPDWFGERTVIGHFLQQLGMLASPRGCQGWCWCEIGPPTRRIPSRTQDEMNSPPVATIGIKIGINQVTERTRGIR